MSWFGLPRLSIRSVCLRPVEVALNKQDGVSRPSHLWANARYGDENGGVETPGDTPRSIQTLTWDPFNSLFLSTVEGRVNLRAEAN